MDTTLVQVRRKKKELEKKILDLLLEFNSDCDVYASDIQLIELDSNIVGGSKKVVRVDIKLSI